MRELEVKFSELIGKTITKIDANKGNDELVIECADDTSYKQFHRQDCCEGVSIEDIAGDIADVIGSPVLVAEESTSNEVQNGKPKHPDSFTWTFYKIDTAKGGITIRWLGESNGYYSEAVDFVRVK